MEYFQLRSSIPGIIVKLGAQGVIVAEKGIVKHYPAVVANKIESVTGAGDSLAAGTIWALLHSLSSPPSLHEAIKYGLVTASLSLQVKEAINPNISIALVKEIVNSLGYKE